MRFIEDIDQNVHSDFMPRRYFKPLKQVLPFYIFNLALVIGALSMRDWFSAPMSAVSVFIALSIAATFLYMRLQQSNDLTMASDFQNLLFASAASLGSSFCFFARNNGTIVYANDGTRKIFPTFAYNQSVAVDQLLDDANVAKENVAKFYSAIALGKKESLVFSMRTADGTVQDFIIIIDPVKRPSGYFVVHGRPFKAEREAKVRLPGILGATNIEKVEALLDQLPIGVYLTNETGTIEYANPALEELSRYGHRELATGGITIQHLIYHADGIETGEFGLEEFTGNILVNCLNKSLSKAFLEQKKISLSNNSSGGYLGIVTPIG